MTSRVEFNIVGMFLEQWDLGKTDYEGMEMDTDSWLLNEFSL